MTLFKLDFKFDSKRNSHYFSKKNKSSPQNNFAEFIYKYGFFKIILISTGSFPCARWNLPYQLGIQYVTGIMAINSFHFKNIFFLILMINTIDCIYNQMALLNADDHFDLHL